MKRENVLIIFSILVLAVLLINIFGNTEKNDSQSMKYSDFIYQVKNKGVITAEIRGSSSIEGRLLDGTDYQTNIPPNHPTLVELLRQNDIQITSLPEEGMPIYLSILISWGPFIFIFAIWILLMKRMQGSAGRLFSLGKSRATRIDPTKRKVTFEDVAGVEECKEELVEIIEFLKSPEKFRKLGGRIPRGVLMSGAPGTGKTLLAKAVAGEADVPFYSISGSDFVEMFVGVGASRVRDLFEEGRKDSPCIIFIDEIDAVGRSRGAGLGSGNDEREQTLNQLLVEMDGFDAQEGIIVIAATNRPDVLDSALLRPGRFDRQVYVPLPDVKGREAILKVHAKKVILTKDINFSVIAKGSPGFSGADLKNLVNEAALGAARLSKEALELSDFEEARDRILMGTERKSLVMSEKEKLRTAYHEAGHALVAILTKNSDPVHKVTIVPRGRALGVTSFLPEGDIRSYDTEYFSGKVTIAMGGRAAEELIFDEITTGASNDIQQATNTVRDMICRYGMNEFIGPVSLEEDEQHHIFGRDFGKPREYAEKTANLIDRELRKSLKMHYKRAKKILTDHVEVLHSMAKLLMEEETIDKSDITALLGQES